MRLFDTHAHYDDEAFDPDRDELLASMPERGVELILNPGCSLESSRAAVELSHRFPFVYAAVGVHPSDCLGFGTETAEKLRELARDPKVRAVGEIGLDYHWDDAPGKEQQLSALHTQLELARELDLPVIIHDRDAHGDCLAAVREHPEVRGVYHCYSGGLEDAKTLVRMGWMLSFTGVITYKNARRSHEVIRWMPMDRLMLETDSPYLPPVPFRGERNHSGRLPLMAQCVAELRGMDADEVALKTLENGKRFFHIED